ncbi:MAG: hypothetical protein J6W04_02245 [Bacteroidales bacterium]|nr:hypothetical protein [Bacteroidales bacterium]
MGGNSKGKMAKRTVTDRYGNVVLGKDGKPVRLRNKKAVPRRKTSGINSKTSPYGIDRWRVNRELNRNADAFGNPIPNNMTKEDELAYIYEYRDLIKAEPEITSDITSISQSTDMTMLGIEKRRKSVKSATRKRNKLIGDDDRTALNDVIRYTLQGSVETFGRDVNKALKKLEESGYEVKLVKNFWTKPWEYKGINVTAQDKKGRLFEIQFHTQNSFAVKDGPMHELYEKQRTLPIGSKEYNRLTQEMLKLAEKEIITPKDVMEIKNKNWM